MPQITKVVKIKDPSDPDTVLFGLNLLNLGPLIIFPKKYPPRSDAIQPDRINMIKNFILESF